MDQWQPHLHYWPSTSSFEYFFFWGFRLVYQDRKYYALFYLHLQEDVCCYCRIDVVLNNCLLTISILLTVCPFIVIIYRRSFLAEELENHPTLHGQSILFFRSACHGLFPLVCQFIPLVLSSHCALLPFIASSWCPR